MNLFLKIGRINLWIGILVAVVNGCSGSSRENSETNQETPQKILWQENSSLTYSLSGSGTPPFKFSLSESSADKNSFTVDENSGLLTSNIVANFESPEDENLDNVYDLIVFTEDSNGIRHSKTLSIKVTNIPEYKNDIYFPPNGSNAGGEMDSLIIRGKVVSDVESEVYPEQISILVNDSPAQFLEGGEVGAWTLEVPLNGKSNTFDIQMFQNGSIIDNHTLIVRNEVVAELGNSISDGSGNVYAISVGNHKLVKLNELGESIVVFSLQDVVGNQICDSLARLRFNPAASKILIQCNSKASTRQGLILYDIEAQSASFLVDKTNIFGGIENVIWIDEERLIIPIEQGEIAYYDLVNHSEREYQFHYSLDGEVFWDSDLLLIEDTFLVSVHLNGEYRWVSFEISDLSNESHIIELQASKIDLKPISRYLAGDKLIRFSSPSVIETQNIYSGDLSDINLFFLDFGNDSPSVIYTSQEVIVVKNNKDDILYKISLNTGEVEMVPGFSKPGTYFNGGLSVSTNSKSDELYVHELNYSKSKRNVFKFDLGDYEFTELKTFKFELDIYDVFYQYIYIDPIDDVMYRSLDLNLGAENAESGPVVFAYDLNENLERVLLTGDQLVSYFGTRDSFGLGRAIRAGDPNLVWFMAASQDPEGKTHQGVYALDKSSSEIMTVWEEENILSEINGYLWPTSYISNWSEALEGVILIQQYSGDWDILKADGTVEPLPEIETDLSGMRSVILGNQGRKLYTRRFDASESAPSNPHWIIFEVDLVTNQVREVSSSNETSQALDFDRPFTVDNRRQNLLSVSDRYIRVMDVYSGKVVLVDLKDVFY